MGISGSKEIQHKKYGWVRDIPDNRDCYYMPNFFKHSFGEDRPTDLRVHCPGIYTQGSLGSCTANAIAAAYEFNEIKDNEKNIFIPSRLFIYYNERNMEGTVGYDSGAQLRDGIKSIHTIGVCPETECPYDINTFTVKPDKKCYEIAQQHKCTSYKRVRQDILHMKECISSGQPFVFGFSVYTSFESPEVAKTGVMTMPAPDDKLLGGHAVMAVGYNDDNGVFIIRNSWGVEWGDNGYFYMPYEFITNPNLCSDFWMIEKIYDNDIPLVDYTTK